MTMEVSMPKNRETRSKGSTQKKELKGAIKKRGLGTITRQQSPTAQKCVVSNKPTTTLAKLGDKTIPIAPRHFKQAARVFREMTI